MTLLQNIFKHYRDMIFLLFLVSENADPDDPDPLSLYTYPRLIIVRKSDHHHAAFYPPLTRPRFENEEFSKDIILGFVQLYLEDPKNLIVGTEHF